MTTTLHTNAPGTGCPFCGKAHGARPMSSAATPDLLAFAERFINEFDSSTSDDEIDLAALYDAAHAAVAAWLATHTPIAQRYQLIAGAGAELQPACPFCHKEAHARACAPLRAKLMRGGR